ncbi:MAG TPA: hypothetical protein VNG51_27565 [Ktedonobacteraceae bacterium]|nr:hypothetical protein [Ktedonobacteraceae bacterium]
MQGYGDNFIPVIPENEADMLHRQGNPFCPIDPTCPCHEDPTLIAEVAEYVTDGLLTPMEATDFVKGHMV